ncbi:transcription repressor OFP1-like [Wolffia australiana]
MGKLRMGDMVPNAWLNKLKNKSIPEMKPNPEPPLPPYQPGRSSNYIPSNPSKALEEDEDLELISPPPSLPPILTKPIRADIELISSTSSRGIRVRTSSPKLAMASKKIQPTYRRPSSTKTCLAKSFAVVMFSSDPQKDFKESMEEMIMENNLRTCADLEELLLCFLSLNSSEFHHAIVAAFEQILSDRYRRPRHCR